MGRWWQEGQALLALLGVARHTVDEETHGPPLAAFTRREMRAGKVSRHAGRRGVAGR